MLVQKTKRTGRRLKAALLVALAGGSMSLLGSSAALAAVLSFGTFPGGVFGGQNCADVQAASLAASTPVNAFNCTAGPNQQFEFSGKTIYAARVRITLACSASPGRMFRGTPPRFEPLFDPLLINPPAIKPA